MVVLMFFIENRQFHNEEERQTFAGNMLHRNRFLFNNNDGDDYTVCRIILSLSNLMFCRSGRGSGKTLSYYKRLPHTSTLLPAVCRFRRYIVKTLAHKQRLLSLSQL